MVLVDHEYLTGRNLQVDPACEPVPPSLSFSRSRSHSLLSRSSLIPHPTALLLARAFRSASFFRSTVQRRVEACARYRRARLDSRGVNALGKKGGRLLNCLAVLKSSRF